MSGRGQPTKLTPEVLEDVRRLLPTVLYIETVADYIGVSRMSIRNWIGRGKKEKRHRDKDGKPNEQEAVYLEFYSVVRKALAEGEIYDAGVIKKASETQWQAAAWRLERRFPDRWGRNDSAETRELLKEVKELKAELVEIKRARQRETAS